MKKNNNNVRLFVNGENIIIAILQAILIFTLSLMSYYIELFFKYENYIILLIIISIVFLAIKIGLK